MFIILSILLVCCTIAVHELGHAFKMKKYGIPITEISIIGVGPKIFSFKLKKYFGDIPINIRLLPIGAFVRNTKEGTIQMLELSSWKHGDILFSGCANNFLFAGILLILVPIFEWQGVQLSQILYITILLTFGLFPKQTFPIAILLGTVILVWVFYAVIGDLFTKEYIIEDKGGLTAISTAIKTESTSFIKTLKFGAMFSIAIGVLNCMPMFPLDGGQIVYKFLLNLKLKKYIGYIFTFGTFIILLTLILESIIGDIVVAIRAIF